jgi:hypothetical protein
MKTLREILFERHRQVDGRLDEMRREALSALVTRSSYQEQPVKPWREWMAWFGPGRLKLHLAGLAAVWLITVILTVAGSASGRAMAAAHGAKANIGEIVRENRRQVRELVNAQDATELANPPVQARPAPARKLRSEIPQTNSTPFMV